MKLLCSVGVLSLGLALAGCSDDAASTGRSPSSSNSTSTAAAVCRVDGFVPGHRVVLRSNKPEILYAHGVSLAPGSRSRGTSEADLLSLPRGAPGLRVSAPAGADLDRGTASAITRSVGHSSAARIEEVAELSWDLRNRGGSTSPTSSTPGRPSTGGPGAHASAEAASTTGARSPPTGAASSRWGRCAGGSCCAAAPSRGTPPGCSVMQPRRPAAEPTDRRRVLGYVDQARRWSGRRRRSGKMGR